MEKDYLKILKELSNNSYRVAFSFLRYFLKKKK